MASVVLKGMYARRMFTQYCYDRVVFFIAGLFLILSSLPSSQSRSLWKHTRVVRFVILFFFYPWGGKTERNRDKDQRENERHKPPSLSENVPFSNWKKKKYAFHGTTYNEIETTHFHLSSRDKLKFRWDWRKVNLNRMRNF